MHLLLLCACVHNSFVVAGLQVLHLPLNPHLHDSGYITEPKKFRESDSTRASHSTMGHLAILDCVPVFLAAANLIAAILVSSLLEIACVNAGVLDAERLRSVPRQSKGVSQCRGAVRKGAFGTHPSVFISLTLRFLNHGAAPTRSASPSRRKIVQPESSFGSSHNSWFHEQH